MASDLPKTEGKKKNMLDTFESADIAQRQAQSTRVGCLVLFKQHQKTKMKKPATLDEDLVDLMPGAPQVGES